MADTPLLAKSLSQPRHGTCTECLAKFVMNKDGALRTHSAPTPPGAPTEPCKGAGKLPLESVPLTSESLQALVRLVLKRAHLVAPYQHETHVAQELHRFLGPRLRQLEGENAMLTDTVVMASALWFEEIEPGPEQDYASECLHETAKELKEKHPRLRGSG
ncbi:hypothetical protein [Streptomyces sp. cg35]|uniref:hypothetical protein n=1 Tax=Streptomyces sp. cg35 TaxID=3421650 RepID=UPI003D177DDD